MKCALFILVFICLFIHLPIYLLLIYYLFVFYIFKTQEMEIGDHGLRVHVEMAIGTGIVIVTIRPQLTVEKSARDRVRKEVLAMEWHGGMPAYMYSQWGCYQVHVFYWLYDLTTEPKKMCS